ncbi:biotin/lipoyl-containing protein [Nocardioides sp. T2.26MG-1]|uniref:biotin/lipoyl-containing protein n=1 Tax=Nocardioides sp. T2.26MG-1 TaxID=3041166 RepID=UPI0024777827|nr:biotin/lipoyl-containing protein [Nocardioides sp. T2.26MG-1]CAI9409200.1 Methylmalonyl-CoA carboxyltransferase 1.3S subunit [Nocardioides sp. T2.26MG-1]
MQLKVTVNGQVYEVEVEVEEEQPPTLGIFMAGGNFAPPVAASNGAPAGGASDGEGVRAPLAGTVARILVEEGEAIEAGAVLVVLEAMKMETEITAPAAGTVGQVLVKPGEAVTGGQLLVELS